MKQKVSPASVYLKRLAPSGRQTQKHALTLAATLIRGAEVDRIDRYGWHKLRYSDTVRLRQALTVRYAPATANRILAAVRGVLREAWRLGLMSAEDMTRAIDLPCVRGTSAPRGRALDASEVDRLYAATSDSTLAGIRDGAAIALMHAAGLRRAEVVQLDVQAVDTSTGEVTVIGKGSRRRVTYLGNALPWVTAWLEARGRGPGPLLLAVHDDVVTSEPLTQSGLYWIVKRRARLATLGTVTPHDLRRTFASALLDAGADIALVRGLMGHASVSTTVGYDRRPASARAEGQARLRVPAVAPR